MWSSKMAAPRRGKDGDLNAGNGDFLCGNTHHEFSLCRGDVSPQSCVDHHSILAIFEDSALSSEDKSSAEMESETLLSALTEMLDSVEDDVEVLSPFDTLPDTKLLRCPERRGQLADEASFADRLRPRSKPSHETLTEEENKAGGARVPQDLKQREPTRFHPKTTKPEREVEVFTTTSLVNLVKIMHPYCLRLHVEEEGRGRASAAPWDKPRKRRAVFSQEQVWRYQRPTGDSDEEINVVSDEEAEAPLEGGKEGVEGANGKLLKSVLLNGGSPRALPSRGKKRVSFGPVEVTSFDESAERNPEQEEEAAAAQTNNAEAPENQQQETGSAKVGEPPPPPPKAEAKAKSLSLQQYRQLRQTRQPLVEKQGNNTTKWPSVPMAPKELTPILCLQGRGPANRALSQHVPLPSGPQPSAPARGGALSRLRAEAQIISPMSPLPDATAEARRQMQTVSSDPPNPVFLRLPAGPSTNTLEPPQCPSTAPPSHLRNSEQCSAAQENKASKPPPTSTHVKPHSDSRSAHNSPTIPKNPQAPPTSSMPTTSQEIPKPAEDTSPAGSSTLPPLEGLKPDRGERNTASDSGIEAPDLTSLLEQFEEKQAKSEGGSEQVPKAKVDRATLPLNLQSLEDVGAEKETPPRAGPLKASEVLPDVQTVPEPLGTEVVLSTQGEQTARRKNPTTKAIQIIDPRPLPPKRTNSGGSEVHAAHSSPHALSSVASDHDYCALPWPCQPYVLRDADKSSADVPAATHNSSVADCKKQLPITTATVATVRAIAATGGLQQSSRAETNPSTDRASVFSGQADAGKEHIAACTLPTPPPSPLRRGREKRRYRRRSPRSDSSSRSSSTSSSSSSSESRSPKRPRLHPKRSESSSCSSSSSSCSPPRRYRLSRSRSRCSRSRSRSWSRSRSRSRSPPSLPRRTYRHRWRDVCSSRESRRLRREHEMRIQKLKAIDERRVVYVGRISRSMTHDELRERFSQFGEVECVSLHFRDKGDHYGFVTFYNMEDAFAAIDNGGKLRRPDELPFDICFGGRRQFCNSDYADLDANRSADLSPARGRFEELDFDSLLKQAQKGQNT